MEELNKIFTGKDYKFVPAYTEDGDVQLVLVVNDFSLILRNLYLEGKLNTENIKGFFDATELVIEFDSARRVHLPSYRVAKNRFNWDVISWVGSDDYQTVCGREVFYSPCMPKLSEPVSGLYSPSFGKVFKPAKNSVYVSKDDICSYKPQYITERNGSYIIVKSVGYVTVSYIEQDKDKAYALDFILGKIQSKNSLESFRKESVILVEELPQDFNYYRGGVYSWSPFSNVNSDEALKKLAKKNKNLTELVLSLTESKELLEVSLREKDVQISILTKQVEELVSKNKALSEYIKEAM